MAALKKPLMTNYIKMIKEQIHFSATLVEKRQKDKAFGKMVKNVIKDKNYKKK